MNTIDHVTIQNYRAIQKIEFSPKPINIFVGRNNCGKSSILQALALNLAGSTNFKDAVGNNIWVDLVYGKKYNVDFLPFNGTNQITIECKINKHHLKSTIEIISDGYPNDERGSIIQTFFQKKIEEFLQKESTVSQIKETYFSLGKKSDTRQLTFDGISQPSTYQDEIENPPISENYDILKNYFHNYISHLKDELTIDLFKQRKVVFSGYRDNKLEYISIVFLNAPIRRMPSERYPSSSDNLTRRFFMEFLDNRMSSRLAIVNIYNTKKDNLSVLIANLEHSNEPFDISRLHDLSIESNKINKTLENLRGKIPYFQDIRKTDFGLQIFVKGQNNPLPLSSMGDGFNSLLKLTFMNNFLNNGTIILEEPEISLHPGFLFILCEAMMSNSKESQFFISTHSIDFIKTILKVSEWSKQLDNIQIIRMHSQPDIQNLEIETISGICAKDEIENIGRDLRGI